MQKNKQERFLIAKDAWSANQIMKRIAQGRLDAEQVLFPSCHAAVKRVQRMSRTEQPKFSIFKTDYQQKDNLQ